VNRFSLAAVALLCAGSSAAQTTDRGPLALTLPASARMGGMGDVGVAGRDDDVIFYNPAQLFAARGTSFSLTRLSETARGGTMSTVLRLGPGAVGFGVNYLEYQSGLSYPFERRDIVGRGILPGTSALGAIGYAQVYKGIRLGVAAKYGMDILNLQRFASTYIDVGVARDFGRYTTALSVQNLGQSASRGSEEIEAPGQATLGVATARPVGPLDVYLTAATSMNMDQELSGGGGAEVGWSWLSGYSIAGRVGVHHGREGDNTDVMAGFGFTADRMTLDIAAERLPGDRLGYRAGIRIR
jgi:hypothetical protein